VETSRLRNYNSLLFGSVLEIQAAPFAAQSVISSVVPRLRDPIQDTWMWGGLNDVRDEIRKMGF
jgi:hypothetical protein